MRNWDKFQLYEPRPADVKVFAESERAELELIVAHQVANLLSDYGAIEEVELDAGACDDVEDVQTFCALVLEPIVLEDDSELNIGQIPLVHGNFDPSPGWNTIVQEDEYGVLAIEIVIHDPSHKDVPLVQDPEGEPIDLQTLQELYEAIAVINIDFAISGSRNDPPLNSAEYPVAVTTPEFEAIIDGLGFSE